MSPRRDETWPGGYIRRDERGRATYWIRRQVHGRRYEVSTRCSTLRAAVAELERWERDPEGYGATTTGGALRLDAALAARYLADLDRAGTSHEWWTRSRTLLDWWARQLRGLDLRRLSLQRHVLDALPASGRRDRIAVLKRVYSWLRERGEITAAEDPTLDRLRVPQSSPEQWTRSKVISRDDYERVRGHLVGTYRDALDVLAATGWHVTELRRFAVAGDVEPYRGEQAGVAAVLCCPRHKSGAPHRTAVGSEAADAARRLREHGGLSQSRLHRAVLDACRLAGVTAFGPGQFRHSVATWAVEAGADPAAVAAFLGHRSATTTKRFYATLAVPPKVPTLR